MHTQRFTVFGVEPFPELASQRSLAPAIASAVLRTPLADGDILVVASKVVSVDEGRRVQLDKIVPGAEAVEIATQISKDPRLIQLVLDESSGYRLATPTGPIVAVHRLGYELTSAGVDRDGPDFAYLLPIDPDRSARRLAEALARLRNVNVAVIVADSDGRPDRQGSTVIAIGSAGLAPLREAPIPTGDGRQAKRQQETFVDLLAAAAGVVIGQRGRGAPVAVIRGVEFTPSEDGVRSILHSRLEP